MDTKVLTLVYNPSKVSSDEILKKIAKSATITKGLKPVIKLIMHYRVADSEKIQNLDIPQ